MDSPTGIKKTEGLGRARYKVLSYCSFLHIVSVKRKKALQVTISVRTWSDCLKLLGNIIPNWFRAGMTKLSIDAVDI